MSVNTGFRDLQKEVNASDDAVTTARRRRNVFRSGLVVAADVLEIVPTGSVARGTQIEPIHDVDLVAVFAPGAHSDWGVPGESAERALEHTRQTVKDRMGTSSDSDEIVRHTLLNTHSVKCFLDPPDDENAFTVDVTPALRGAEGGILIPERTTGSWIASDPEDLNRRIANRHSEWNEFARIVRILKRWNLDNGKIMKSLVVEVLAYELLPVLDKPLAISRFFGAAQDAVLSAVCDPSGLCGEIQSDLDRNKAHELLAVAADASWRAVDAASRGEDAQAMCLWRQIFGAIYPEPEGGCGGGVGAVAAGAVAAATIPSFSVARPKRPIRDAPQG